MKMRFKGKPDAVFPWLRTGEVYDVYVEYVHRTLFKGSHFGNEVLAAYIDGYKCIYSSLETFLANWDYVE